MGTSTPSARVAEPELSVVVASVNGMPYLDECLASLAANAPEAEVVVADWTDEETRASVRERWPDVRLLSFDRPMAVPELRAAGIAAAQAPYVAVIEDHCVVPEGWSGGSSRPTVRAGRSSAARSGTRRPDVCATGPPSSASTASTWSPHRPGRCRHFRG